MNFLLAGVALYLAAAADTVVAPRLDWRGAAPQFCLTVAVLWCLRQPSGRSTFTACGLGLVAELCGGGVPGGCVLGLASAGVLLSRARQWWQVAPTAGQLVPASLGVGMAVAIERCWTWGLGTGVPAGGFVEPLAATVAGAVAWSIPLAWMAARAAAPVDGTASL